ncbi:imidazole glycerol phosphate synthase subunit HisH [bacterium]|nr:imidazole glycerol phosphate synthase subunit HisH [bacterium]MBU1990608.1 imidazole glycerol phosphate synthase subunit HisH [bacterium]
MVSIIDYGMGNSASVKKAFDFLNIPCRITNKAQDIKTADKLLIPGVGSYGDAIQALHALELFELLKEEVLVNKKPILGICLGMQLMGCSSAESEGVSGFGFIDSTCQRFDIDLKVPHVGWNNAKIVNKDSRLFKNIPDNSDFYFVHSYHFGINTKEKSTTVKYGYDFASSFEKDNIFGVQFHPEKSQKYGLELLKNFGELQC